MGGARGPSSGKAADLKNGGLRYLAISRFRVLEKSATGVLVEVFEAESPPSPSKPKNTNRR